MEKLEFLIFVNQIPNKKLLEKMEYGELLKEIINILMVYFKHKNMN